MDAMEPARLLWPWDSPGKNAGMDYQALLQGICLTPGSNPLVSPAMAGKLFTTTTTWDILPQNGKPSEHDKLGPAYPQPSNSSPEETELQSYLKIIALLSL